MGIQTKGLIFIGIFVAVSAGTGVFIEYIQLTFFQTKMAVPLLSPTGGKYLPLKWLCNGTVKPYILIQIISPGGRIKIMCQFSLVISLEEDRECCITGYVHRTPCGACHWCPPLGPPFRHHFTPVMFTPQTVMLGGILPSIHHGRARKVTIHGMPWFAFHCFNLV